MKDSRVVSCRPIISLILPGMETKECSEQQSNRNGGQTVNGSSDKSKDHETDKTLDTRKEVDNRKSVGKTTPSKSSRSSVPIDDDSETEKEEESNTDEDPVDDNSDEEEGNNTWDCSVCTFKNSAEAFKCLMCDVRKGTSTRKPRINPQVVAQQVARQQQQIQQQLLKASHRTKDHHHHHHSSSSESSKDKSRLKHPTPTSCSPSSSIGAASTSSLDVSFHGKRRNSEEASPTPGKKAKSIDEVFKQLKKSKKTESKAKASVKKKVDESNGGGKTRKKYNVKGNRDEVGNIISKPKKMTGRKTLSTEAVTVNNVTVLITEFKLLKKKPKDPTQVKKKRQENRTDEDNASSSVKIKKKSAKKVKDPESDSLPKIHKKKEVTDKLKKSKKVKDFEGHKNVSSKDSLSVKTPSSSNGCCASSASLVSSSTSTSSCVAIKDLVPGTDNVTSMVASNNLPSSSVDESSKSLSTTSVQAALK